MNENILTLEIISINHQEFHKIQWLEVETPSGNVTICLGHAPMITLLRKKGIITFQSIEGIDHAQEIGNGFLIANDKTVSIFVD